MPRAKEMEMVPYWMTAADNASYTVFDVEVLFPVWKRQGQPGKWKICPRQHSPVLPTWGLEP